MYLADYHVHPGYSMDAEPWSIHHYCQRAVELGLQEICFTTHFECDPLRKHIDWLVRLNGRLLPMDQWSWVDHYLSEIEKAKGVFKPAGLTVRAGVEVGYGLGLEPVIEKLVTDYPWDYVLGSVHCLDHIAISSRKESPTYFQGRTAKQVCQDYYKIMAEAVGTGFFDCVGHLDIYKRYGLDYLGEEINEVELEHGERILRQMARQGMGLEINTSRKRKGQDFFPSVRLLKLARECGVKIFTVGSDAHSVSELGQGLLQAVELLYEHGLSLHGFHQRVPKAIR
ncbi:MAG: histidinol-phosphatase [Firmicutes bacterium]|nr:histidinol-phosphatase [Bacillota bacterium]